MRMPKIRPAELLRRAAVGTTAHQRTKSPVNSLAKARDLRQNDAALRLSSGPRAPASCDTLGRWRREWNWDRTFSQRAMVPIIACGLIKLPQMLTISAYLFRRRPTGIPEG